MPFSTFAYYVDVWERNFLLCVLNILLTSWMWNVVCIWDLKTRTLSKWCGSRKTACILQGIIQMVVSNLRNYYFGLAVAAQPQLSLGFDPLLLRIVEYILIGAGGTFVFSSFVRLGWFGTYHGMFFGILLPEKLTGFPFNVLENPMYIGAVMVYLGHALGKQSIVGLFLALTVHVVYDIAAKYIEVPYTIQIYAQLEQKKAQFKSK